MNHHPLRDAIPLVTVVVAALSAATAANALSLIVAPIGIDDRSTVFAGRLRPNEQDLLVTTGRNGLVVTLGDAVIEDPFVVDSDRPVAVCADGVALTGHTIGGAAVVVASTLDGALTLTWHQLDARPVTRVAPVLLDGHCSFVVVDASGVLWWLRQDGTAHFGPVIAPVPNANEHPRGLPVSVRGHVVDIIDGLGQRATFDLVTEARGVLGPVGPAWPEVVDADDGSWLVTVGGDLLHIRGTDGGVTVTKGAGPATAGPTPFGGEDDRLAWPLANGRIALATNGVVVTSAPLGSTCRQPLLVLPIDDDGGTPRLVAALEDGRLVVLADDDGDVLAVADGGARPHGPISAHQATADSLPGLELRRGDGRTSHLALGLVPARPWHSVEGAVLAPFIQVGASGVRPWRGPSLSALGPIPQSPAARPPLTVEATAAPAVASCAGANTAPMLLFLVVLGRRRRRHVRNETAAQQPGRHLDAKTHPDHRFVPDWDTPGAHQVGPRVVGL